MLTVVTSGKTSPGTTTASWALALSFPAPLLVADCDPQGGDMAAGYLVGRVLADRGLVSWSTAARRGMPALESAALLAQHAVELPERPEVWLIPGFATQAQEGAFTEQAWERLALALARCPTALGRDALVDTGRLDEQRHGPLLRAADLVLLVVRPSVRSVHAAHGVATRIRYELGDLAKVRALVVADGPYSASEVAQALQVELAAVFPYDRAAALVLSDGGPSIRGLMRSPLLRAARELATSPIATVPQSDGVDASYQTQAVGS